MMDFRKKIKIFSFLLLLLAALLPLLASIYVRIFHAEQFGKYTILVGGNIFENLIILLILFLPFIIVSSFIIFLFRKETCFKTNLIKNLSGILGIFITFFCYLFWVWRSDISKDAMTIGGYLLGGTFVSGFSYIIFYLFGEVLARLLGYATWFGGKDTHND